MQVKIITKEEKEIVSKNYESYNDFEKDAIDLFDNLNPYQNVFVSFIQWDECDSQINLVHAILVTHFVIDLHFFAEYQFNEVGNTNECKLNIHEFENHQEAFDFCKLLKEGV
jgi:hypothetical protein